jgi:5-methylcytosine-specific restriction endonuclease McrA
MQDTLIQDTQKNHNTDCDYSCLINIETCPEIKGCKIKNKLLSHIKSRHRSHTKKAQEKFFIDPPKILDIAILFKDSLNEGFNCKYCNTHLDIYATAGMIGLIPAISLDHIIPLSNGGNNKLSNLQLICHRCNIVKNKIHPDHFDTIVFVLKEKYGTGGLINFMNAIYPSLFTNEFCNKEGNE